MTRNKIIKCRRLAFVILLLLVVSVAYAQQSVKELKSYMSKVKAGTNASVPEVVLEDDNNAEKLLDALQKLRKDTVENVRMVAYDLSRRIAVDHPQEKVREKAVVVLSEGLTDKSSAVTASIFSSLSYFKPADFSSKAKAAVTAQLSKPIAHKDELVKLIGYLQMKEELPALYTIFNDPRLPKRDKWAAYLALARLGDEEALEFVVSRVRRLPVNDDVVYDILPDLVYVRRPETFQYLVEIINSNEKNCEAADAETEGNILCGYRVVEYVAPVIKNFPLKIDISGDLEVQDYQQALITAREWFKDNPKFELVLDRY